MPHPTVANMKFTSLKDHSFTSAMAPVTANGRIVATTALWHCLGTSPPVEVYREARSPTEIYVHNGPGWLLPVRRENKLRSIVNVHTMFCTSTH